MAAILFLITAAREGQLLPVTAAAAAVRLHFMVLVPQVLMVFQAAIQRRAVMPLQPVGLEVAAAVQRRVIPA
jgi:hypothetical protein